MYIQANSWMMPPSGEKNLTLHSSGKILNLLYKKTQARIPVMLVQVSFFGTSQHLDVRLSFSNSEFTKTSLHSSVNFASVFKERVAA